MLKHAPPSSSSVCIQGAGDRQRAVACRGPSLAEVDRQGGADEDLQRPVGLSMRMRTTHKHLCRRRAREACLCAAVQEQEQRGWRQQQPSSLLLRRATEKAVWGQSVEEEGSLGLANKGLECDSGWSCNYAHYGKFASSTV